MRPRRPDNRFWWLKPGKEEFRCKGQRVGKVNPGRCEALAVIDGYCKAHHRIQQTPVCVECKRPL